MQFYRLALAAFAILLLGAGCTGTVPGSGMPEEFWGVAGWQFEKSSALKYGASGAGTVTLRFVEQYVDATSQQFSVEGTITYHEDRFDCVYEGPSNSICPAPSCTVASTREGAITGVAIYADGVLTVKPRWHDQQYPYEYIETTCGRETSTMNTVTLFQQALQAKDGMIENDWAIEVDQAQFIDDLPEGYAGSDATMSKSFSTRIPEFVTGQGLLGLYRSEPN